MFYKLIIVHLRILCDSTTSLSSLGNTALLLNKFARLPAVIMWNGGGGRWKYFGYLIVPGMVCFLGDLGADENPN